MFFMIGISDGRKQLDFSQTVICDQCGKYGRYTVFMTYMVLSLFFIPCFKWNKQYFVQSSCCGTMYRLNPEVGRRIARGEDVEIRSEDLELLNRFDQRGRQHKCCQNCGYITEEDFEFCPKCGQRF